MGITTSGRLILASASPRRIEILKLMDLDFDIIPANIDETFRPGETARAHALRLGEEKALFVAESHPEAWVLGADTIVVVKGEILGKPRSPEEATEMLEKLSDRTHEVLTGFCIIGQDRGIRLREVVSSEVIFRKIAPDEIAWYTGTEEPFDKAGAYAVQGMGGCFVREIRGSCTNVVGLPLCEVIEALKSVAAIKFEK